MPTLFVSALFRLNPCPEGLYVFLKHFRDGRMPITKKNILQVISDPDFSKHLYWVCSRLDVSDDYSKLVQRYGRGEMDWEVLLDKTACLIHKTLLRRERFHYPHYLHNPLPVAE